VFLLKSFIIFLNHAILQKCVRNARDLTKVKPHEIQIHGLVLQNTRIIYTWSYVIVKLQNWSVKKSS